MFSSIPSSLTFTYLSSAILKHWHQMLQAQLQAMEAEREQQRQRLAALEAERELELQRLAALEAK